MFSVDSNKENIYSFKFFTKRFIVLGGDLSDIILIRQLGRKLRPFWSKMNSVFAFR